MKDLLKSMRRRTFPLFLSFILTLTLTQLLACAYSAPSMTNPQGTNIVNGTVSLVTLTSVLSTSGGMQDATAVNLTVPLGTTSLVLCGDQRSSFAVNSAVQVSYTNGTYCSTLVSVQPM